MYPYVQDLIMHGVSLISGLSTAAAARASSNKKPASAGSLYFVFFLHLTLFDWRVSICQHPANKHALLLLIIPLDKRRSSSLEILTVPLRIYTSISNKGCNFSHKDFLVSSTSNNKTHYNLEL